MEQHSLDHLHGRVPPSYYHHGVKYNLAQKYWHWRRRRVISRMIKGVGGNFVDLGSHGGYLTEFMASQAKARHVTAIDVSPESIDFIKKRHPDWDAQCANIEEQNNRIQNRSVRFVACVDVLEHLLHPEKVIQEVARIIEKDGIFIIAVPKETWLWKFIWYFWTTVGAGKVWGDVHVQDFSAEDLNKLLLQHGFKKEEDTLVHLGIYRISKYRYAK